MKAQTSSLRKRKKKRKKRENNLPAKSPLQQRFQSH